jgi:hypothetical protein
VVPVIELFTSRRDGLWRVAWRHFDDFGLLIGEGVVSGRPSTNERFARSQLRAIWVELFAARFEIDMVGDAMCVSGDRRDIERAMGRQLLPSADDKVVV